MPFCYIQYFIYTYIMSHNILFRQYICKNSLIDRNIKICKRLLSSSIPSMARTFPDSPSKESIHKQKKMSIKEHIQDINDNADFFDTFNDAEIGKEQKINNNNNNNNIPTNNEDTKSLPTNTQEDKASDWYVNDLELDTLDNSEQYSFTGKLPKWMQVQNRNGSNEGSGIVQPTSTTAYEQRCKKIANDFMTNSEPPTLDPSKPPSVAEIVYLLRLLRGQNIVVIDLKKKSNIAKYMIIVEGNTPRQVYTLIESVKKLTKERNLHKASRMPQLLGKQTDDWLVYNTGSIIVHSFSKEARDKYDLEGLWTMINDPLK